MNSKFEGHTSLPGMLSMVRVALAALLVLLAALPSSAQFSSGSNGSDGALNLTLTTPGVVGGVLLFNPADSTMFDNPTRVLDTDGDHVYHFTTITIGAGLTVRLSSQFLSGPVYWLATQAVAINGIIDLNGETGYSCTNTLPNYSLRRPALGGAGGFNGGVGGWTGGPSALSSQPGSGPGGGANATSGNNNGVGGTLSANLFLIPMVGGSGGGGAFNTAFACFGGGGGGGGGAIVIASSVSITVTSPGAIRANGGDGGAIPGLCCFGGRGSGGAIRLMSQLIAGNGSITASSTGNLPGSPGRLRLEAYQQSFAGSTGGLTAILASPTLLASVLPTGPPPSLRAVSILVPPSTVVSLPANPGGSFTIPDATINFATAVTINIQASNIPITAVVTLHISSETGPDITVTGITLLGTTASSTASASVTFPSGFSRGYVRATF